ncbi:Gp15 family bacteriophage protein [Faecalibacterium sp. 9]|uniref:Gp15 family bacteriophage protein n=1 Tax=Faecalibacterium sp. 9 TaxID=3402018 RepID=UPI003AAE7362
MIEFYKAGEKAAESAAAESSTAPSSGLAFDYQCDAGYIVAAFQQAYGIDLTRERVQLVPVPGAVRGPAGGDPHGQES